MFMAVLPWHEECMLRWSELLTSSQSSSSVPTIVVWRTRSAAGLLGLLLWLVVARPILYIVASGIKALPSMWKAVVAKDETACRRGSRVEQLCGSRDG